MRWLALFSPRPPQAYLPSKKPQTEAQKKKAAREVAAALKALEAAIDAAEKKPKQVERVVKMAARYALAVVKSPGELPPEGTYTDVTSIFAALRPRDDCSGLAPVKLLNSGMRSGLRMFI